MDKPARKRYQINNDWLAFYANNTDKSDHYVDIVEIATNPKDSQYLKDLILMGVSVSLDQEQRRASFYLNGIRVGKTGDIRGTLEEEAQGNDIFINTYMGALKHEENYRRIYAWKTTARSIAFLGYGTTHKGTETPIMYADQK